MNTPVLKRNSRELQTLEFRLWKRNVLDYRKLSETDDLCVDSKGQEANRVDFASLTDDGFQSIDEDEWKRRLDKSPNASHH